MAKKIKRIVSEEVHESEEKSLNDIAKKAIFIEIDPHTSAGSDEMKWDAIGRPLFGDALEQVKENLSKTEEHDFKENPSS
jgi:hypothetical protein